MYRKVFNRSIYEFLSWSNYSRGKQNLDVIIGCDYAAILGGIRYKLDCEKLSRAFAPLVKATW